MLWWPRALTTTPRRGVDVAAGVSGAGDGVLDGGQASEAEDVWSRGQLALEEVGGLLGREALHPLEDCAGELEVLAVDEGDEDGEGVGFGGDLADGDGDGDGHGLVAVCEHGSKHTQGSARGPSHVLRVAQPTNGQEALGGVGAGSQLLEEWDGVVPRGAQDHLKPLAEADKAALDHHRAEAGHGPLAAGLDQHLGRRRADLAVGDAQQIDELLVLSDVVHLR